MIKLTASSFGRAALMGLTAGLLLLVAACGKKPVAAAGDDVFMGDPNAKITVVEYASVACPVCAHVNETVFQDFKKKYVDTGKVKYVYRPMETGSQAVAVAGHLLAACAGKDKYFDVIDAIMRSQDEMGGEQTGYANAGPVLKGIAKQVGLSDDQFDKCIKDPQGIQHMNDLSNQYLSAGFDQTPIFVVNGKRMNGTPQDISDFDKAIASAPAAAK